MTSFGAERRGKDLRGVDGRGGHGLLISVAEDRLHRLADDRRGSASVRRVWLVLQGNHASTHTLIRQCDRADHSVRVIGNVAKHQPGETWADAWNVAQAQARGRQVHGQKDSSARRCGAIVFGGS